MADTNKVTVNIYGQNYTITGDKPKDEIQRVASHVDDIMHEIAEVVGGGTISSVAVLTAVNIADELYDFKVKVGSYDDEKERLKVDVDHYKQLLERVRNEFQQYKKDVRESLERKSVLDEALVAKQKELDVLAQRVAELESQNERLKAHDDIQAGASERVRELEDRCREVEGNYFEIQMENIRLKGELESYRKENE